MSRTPAPNFNNVDFGVLIEQLGPLNNRWRTSFPSEKVLTLWAMGDVLLMAHPNPSDSLLWEIQKRSYITRVVLRYALIVRRSWAKRQDLEALVTDLRSYTVFREALPFLKGKREGIDDATYLRVLELLHNPNPQKAVSEIKELKSQIIGRQHTKGASVVAIRDSALKFREALNKLESEVKAGFRNELIQIPEILLTLSSSAVVVATGDDSEKPQPLIVNDPLLSQIADALTAARNGGPATTAAFRKLVGPSRLMEAADLLNSCRSKEELNEWRRRHSSSAGTDVT